MENVNAGPIFDAALSAVRELGCTCEPIVGVVLVRAGVIDVCYDHDDVCSLLQRLRADRN